MDSPMRVSVMLKPDRSLRDLAHEASAVERAGFDGVWVPDHLTGGGNFDQADSWRGSIAALTAVTLATSSVPVGLLVAGAPVRVPAALSAELRGLADLAGTRLRCGVGAGARADSQLTGLPRRSGERLGEYVDELRARSPHVDVLVAANAEHSQQAAARRGLPTVMYLHSTSTHGTPDAVEALLEHWDHLGHPGPVTLLIDICEPSPWQDARTLADTYRHWAGRGVDELVWWSATSYDQPTSCYQRAARLLAGVRDSPATPDGSTADGPTRHP